MCIKRCSFPSHRFARAEICPPQPSSAYRPLIYCSLYNKKKHQFPKFPIRSLARGPKMADGFHFDCRLPRPALKTYTATEQMHAAHIINVSYMFLGYFFPFNATVALFFTYNPSEES